jgi:uncharacterized protein with PIN domain
MMFIADAMLGSLAKRMRLLGYDVLYDPNTTDNEVLRLALEQGRMILTRDAGLASRPLARDHILIQSDLVEEQLSQILALFLASDQESLTRCSVCNEPLATFDKKEARDLVPDHVFSTINEFWRCGNCGRVYWKGSHVRNMERRKTMK